MSAQSVAVSFASGLTAHAQSIGVDRAVLLEQAGVRAEELQQAEKRLSFAKFVALTRAAQNLSGDPAFALHFGMSPHAETSMTCLMGGFAGSGAEAFALMNRYSRLNVDVDTSGDRFELNHSADGLWVVDTRAHPNDFPELTEITFGCFVYGSRRSSEYSDLLKAVQVTHAAPPYRSEYERVFAIPVMFSSNRNAVLLASDFSMDQTPKTSSAVVLDVLRDRAELLLQELGSETSAKSRVETAVRPMLQAREATIDAVAVKLGMSRQTLFRRLKAEGTTFECVLDDLRRRLALEHLDRGGASIDQVTYILGYSDRSSFARAFKRWTGSTPRKVARP
jgi:AraC-like DNA-binding protein